MGTRHLICVFLDKKYKVAQYGQWDGYPQGQGVDILNFLHGLFANQDKVLEFTRKVEKISWLSNEERSATWDKKRAQKYPELSRDTGSKILSLIQDSAEPLKLRDRLDFSEDSLFCEWCYVIDFDKNTFEVYEGSNRQRLDESERFYNDSPCGVNDYYPVKHKYSFDLNNILDLTENEFLSKTESKDDE